MSRWTLRLLTPSEGPFWGGLTFRVYRPLLTLEQQMLYAEECAPQSVVPFAVGALVDGAPAGLVLGALPVALSDRGSSDRGTSDQEAAQLLSVFVAPAHRQRGLATALIEAFEREAEARGRAEAQAVYTVPLPRTGGPEPLEQAPSDREPPSGPELFERIVGGRGWSAPDARMLICRARLEQARAMPWYRPGALPKRYEVFPWIDRTAEDEATLRRSQAECAWIPSDLEPWRYGTREIEPISSLGLRLEGEVVGWMINHAISRHTVRFTCSFLRRDLSRTGRMLQVWVEAMERLSATAFDRCSLATPKTHPAMQSFVRSWCSPWAEFLGESRGSRVDLAPDRQARTA